MSRIGRLPVVIPQGVTVTFADGVATVKGPLGTLSEEIKGHINLEIKGNEAIFTRDNDEKETKALHGLYRATLHNMVEGVTKGFEKHLMISGVGVKVALQGTKLVMNIGFSHQVTMPEPEGITIEVPAPNKIIISGADKQKVGQFAAEVREKRPPEPYKGKGIKYAEEHIRRKEGKAGKGK